MLGCGFGLHSDVGVVVVTMSSWNKVSPVSPYLVNISGVGEGAVRIGAIRSVGFLWILTVAVSFKGSCSPVYGGTCSISLFVWIYGKVRFLQSYELVVEDCKPALLLGVCDTSPTYL